ncbi:uncharacterized protein J8A68_001618 [[Candida] subhashii]|uniref:TECPR1-like DysF domain-containing protein n=1 Tax=[Candida] subhashii TaxID=561895 RepID=A0A8J5QQP9_9ASCO|nr:uncharacterized protein J8A68_001618 [[Candida] subhashii]KAG7664860.1 hypothetical protein J8A68_001618 [[Candida] subhashii]
MDSQRIRDKALGFLASTIEKSNNFAEARPGSKRAIAVGTASTLMEIGFEQLNKKEDGELTDLTEQEIAQIESMESSAEDVKPASSKHFTDRLFDKLIQTSLPPDITDTMFDEDAASDDDDDDRSSKQSLSFSLLVNNLTKLTAKLTFYFVLQYGILHIITWKQPTKTLTALVLYHGVCLWPHLVLVYPLMYILFGVLVPGYVHKHPMKRSDLIRVSARGQKIWEFFSSEETSIVNEYIEDDYTMDDTLSVSSDNVSVLSQAPSEFASSTEEFKESAKKKKNSQVTLVRNMKQIQKLTTDLLKGIEKAETFYYETGGFKDERLSTFIFYGILIASFVVVFLGQFIPWRFVFISAGWVGLTLCHPNAKKYLLELQNAKKTVAPRYPHAPPESHSAEKQQFDRDDIIVDDAPDIRTVEVFELQTRSSFSGSWSFYRFASTMYGRNDKLRVSKKRPSGVEDLARVLPPKDWMFDFGLVNKWKVDLDPIKFVQEREFDPELFKIDIHEKEGWIYDNLNNVEMMDFDFQVRRRRLFRDCFRYGRPHKTSTSSS